MGTVWAELLDMAGAGVPPGEDMAMGERAIIEENFTGFPGRVRELRGEDWWWCGMLRREGTLAL